MFQSLLNDESGFIISAELVLVATLLVIGLIVGLAEVQHAIVSELNDVAEAIGSVNQTYYYSGFSKRDGFGGAGFFGLHAFTRGSAFIDRMDACDGNECALACDAPANESLKGYYSAPQGYYSAPGAYHTVPSTTVPSTTAPAGDHQPPRVIDESELVVPAEDCPLPQAETTH